MMKKLFKGMNNKLVVGSPSSRGSAPLSECDHMPLDSEQPASSTQSQCEAAQSSQALVGARSTVLMEEEHIIICTLDEEVKFNALRARPSPHTRVYDRYMLVSAGMLTEFPIVFKSVEW